MSRIKTEYLKFHFRDATKNEGEVRLSEMTIPRKDNFKYLCSYMQSDVGIDKDTAHRT